MADSPEFCILRMRVFSLHFPRSHKIAFLSSFSTLRFISCPLYGCPALKLNQGYKLGLSTLIFGKRQMILDLKWFYFLISYSWWDCAALANLFSRNISQLFETGCSKYFSFLLLLWVIACHHLLTYLLGPSLFLFNGLWRSNQNSFQQKISYKTTFTFLFRLHLIFLIWYRLNAEGTQCLSVANLVTW